jgi:hypothetical protein
MREVDVKTIPDSLEELEFEPTCVVVTVNFVEPLPKKCENQAKWVGYAPCCGTSVLVCDLHHISPLPFSCTPCKRQFPALINWHHL